MYLCLSFVVEEEAACRGLSLVRMVRTSNQDLSPGIFFLPKDSFPCVKYIN